MLFSIFTACGRKENYRQVDPREAQGMLLNRLAVLIDVREKEEMGKGIAKPAQWMPMSKIEAQHADWKSFKEKFKGEDTMLIFYCAVGGRAGKVAQLLSKEGFSTGNMGGFRDWVKAKLPVRECTECGL